MRLSGRPWMGLCRERTSAVAAMSAVGVHNDLASGQTGVTHRTADDESTGRIDMMFHAGCVVQAFRHGGLNDVFHQISLDLFIGHIRAVLRGDDDGINTEGLAILVFDCDLGFCRRGGPTSRFFFRTSARRFVKRWAKTIGMGMSSVVSLVA